MWRFKLALLIGKFTYFMLRLRGSRGTALPGLLAEKVDPHFLAKSRRGLGQIVVVSGTNGKTSTQTVLAKILKGYTGSPVLVNSRGANLSRGLVAEIVKNFSLWRQNNFTYTVFEIEEATLPKIITQLQPDIAIITNFFRDQLDAYGEISRTKAHIKNALDLSPETIVVANADDPQVLDCLNQIKERPLHLVQIAQISNYINYEPAARPLTLSQIKNSSLVSYPLPEITKDLGSKLQIGSVNINFKLPGFHSAYALILAIEVLKILIPEAMQNLGKLAEISEQIEPAFGRGEIVGDKQFFLVKNPVGFDLTLDLLAYSSEPLDLVILINDKIADGRDVSWLWDSQLEKLAKLKLKHLYFAGSRGLDIQLRVKYAGIDLPDQKYFADYQQLLKALANPHLANIKIIASYTALNELRDLLTKE